MLSTEDSQSQIIVICQRYLLKMVVWWIVVYAWCFWDRKEMGSLVQLDPSIYQLSRKGRDTFLHRQSEKRGGWKKREWKKGRKGKYYIFTTRLATNFAFCAVNPVSKSCLSPLIQTSENGIFGNFSATSFLQCYPLRIKLHMHNLLWNPRSWNATDVHA